jgi:hypothetical protein
MDQLVDVLAFVTRWKSCEEGASTTIYAALANNTKVCIDILANNTKVCIALANNTKVCIA